MSLSFFHSGFSLLTFCYVAIDAAAPAYIRPEVELSQRLDGSDCEKLVTFCCEKKHFGSQKVLGHINILVNNGTDQPQCGDNIVCDHLSCPVYLIESLRKDEPSNFTITNVDSKASYVLDVLSISGIPNGNYTMKTSPCYPYTLEPNGAPRNFVTNLLIAASLLFASLGVPSQIGGFCWLE